MTSDWAWLNGRWIAARELAIPVWDAGFVFGATVTDLCRTIGHRLFRWSDHVRRFSASAELCEIPLGYSESQLTAVAQELVVRQSQHLAAWEDLAVVLFATPGPIAQYRPMTFDATGARSQQINKQEPTLGLQTFRLPLARYARLWHEGFHLVSVPLAPPADILPRQLKHRSRLHWWRAQRYVERRRPGATALLCETDGALLETAFANLVLVFDGVLATPPLDRVLPGISLQHIAYLAEQLGWQMEYRAIYPEDAQRAKEVFLTSSSFCLLPVRQLDAKTFSCPGPIIEHLIRAWSESVGFDLLSQLNAALAASHDS